jgi:hypothetical protein
MSIPDLTPDGFLPPGVHDCTLDEVRARFGAFQSSDRRPRLFQNLEQFLAEARQSGLVAAVIVDGSFVTAADTPNDVDLILVLRADHDFSATLRPFEYNVVSRRQVTNRHRLDMLVAVDGSDLASEYADFFGRVRGSAALRKGVLRIVF